MMQGKAIAAALGVALALGAGGVATAAHSSGGDKAAGTIHACVTSKHATFIGRHCKAGESSLVWNRRGPRGLTGPQGPQGPQGPEGPMGPAGSTYIHQTPGSDVVIPANDSAPATVTCANGQVLSGTWSTQDAFARVFITANFQVDFNTWRFRFFNNENAVETVTVASMCAST